MKGFEIDIVGNDDHCKTCFKAFLSDECLYCVGFFMWMQCKYDNVSYKRFVNMSENDTPFSFVKLVI